MVKNPPANAEHRFDPWSGKIPHAAEQISQCTMTSELVLLSPGTTSTEPTHCTCRSLCSTTRETTAVRSPSTHLDSSSHSLQPEKSQRSSDPAQPKNKQVKRRRISTYIYICPLGQIPSPSGPLTPVTEVSNRIL